MQALVDHDHVAGLLEQLLILEREEPTDVHEEVLLRAHGAAVGERADLAKDLGE